MKIKNKHVLLLAISPLALTTMMGCNQNSSQKEMITEEKSLITINESGGLNNIKVLSSFEKGVDEIPYVSLKNLGEFFRLFFDNQNITITKDIEAQTAVVYRENVDASMTIDFKNDTISFDDLNAFNTADMIKSTELDLVSNAFNTADNDNVILRDERHTIYVRGFSKIIDAQNYGIDLIWSNDEGYIPIQVLSDFVFGRIALPICYNGKEFYIVPFDLFQSIPQLMEMYHQGKKEKTMRSKALAEFTYGTLCMNLDIHYGLKESHGITTNFDDYFARTGLKEDLLSLDPDKSTNAMANLCHFYFDDGHSGFVLQSSYTPSPDLKVRLGTTASDIFAQEQMMKEFFNKRDIDSTIPYYQEVGDTAIIYFNGFHSTASSYYLEDYRPSNENMWWVEKNDTLGLVQHAHHMITREGSPIKNVVLDLSFNGGGSIDAAAYLLSWMTGEKRALSSNYFDLNPGHINYIDTSTDAFLTQAYYGDVNLDHIFDEKDMLSTYVRNVYCLTSGYSFSCGNLVPAILKETNKATLIGQKTSGGTCAVFPISTADGTLLKISGPYTIATNKNGSFYGIDRGIEPDVYVRDLNVLFDSKGDIFRGQLIDLIKEIK